MRKQELEQHLFKITPSEESYLKKQGTISPRFSYASRFVKTEKEVMIFNLPTLEKEKIILRKDSRFEEIPPYAYSSININYIYSGECSYIIDDMKVTLHKGDICIFDWGVVRTKQMIDYNDIVININISNQFFEGSIRHLSEQNIISTFLMDTLSDSSEHDNYIIFRTEENLEIMELFNRLLMEYFSQKQYRHEIMQQYLSIIMMELLRLYQTNKDIHSVQLPSATHNKLLEILYYIEKNYVSCTLAELAKKFGYHEKYMPVYLKKATGKTFKQIQNDYRMKNALKYVLNSNLPINEIAEKTGFTNHKRFYQLFKDTYGLMPKSYRQFYCSDADK